MPENQLLLGPCSHPHGYTRVEIDHRGKTTVRSQCYICGYLPLVDPNFTMEINGGTMYVLGPDGKRLEIGIVENLRFASTALTDASTTQSNYYPTIAPPGSISFDMDFIDSTGVIDILDLMTAQKAVDREFSRRSKR